MAKEKSTKDINIDHLAAFIGFVALVAAFVGIWLPSLNNRNNEVEALIEKFEERVDYLSSLPQISCVKKASYELPDLFFDAGDFSYSNIILYCKSKSDPFEEIVLLINSQDAKHKQDVQIDSEFQRYLKSKEQTLGKTKLTFSGVEGDLTIPISIRSDIRNDSLSCQVYCPNAVIVDNFRKGDYSTSIDVSRLDYYKLDPAQIDDIKTIGAIINSLSEHQVKYLYIYNQYMKTSFFILLIIICVGCIIWLIYI